MLLQMELSYSFLQLSNIAVCVCITPSLSMHLLMGIYAAFMSWLLAIVLQWTLGACIFLNYSFLWIYISRSGIAGSHGSSIFSFFEEPPYYSSGCTNLTLPPTELEGYFSSTPSLANIVDFLLMATLTGVRGYLTVVLIWMS